MEGDSMKWTTGDRLLAVKKATGWSWEKLCRDLHRVQGNEGPSHTTLFRYARRRPRRPNKLTEKWINEGIEKLIEEGL